MTPERWVRLKQLIDAAADLEPSQRQSFLGVVCGDDRALRAEADSILTAADQAGDFLESPAVEALVTDLTVPRHDALIGQCLGAYRVARRLATGGMGAVYLGERADEQFHKEVAIKLIRCDLLQGAEALRRFYLERQTLANLDHPNIAKLLDGGMTAEGLPYLVMEYVRGVPIDEYCDRQRLDTRQRLELFRTVCAAVQYAHQNLTVHRDLKPGNILVTEDGIPKLLDFGIAKVLAPECSAGTANSTRTNHRCLTPEYASPEQIRGEPITTRSDVYSLGVVLYELLTGRRPFRTKSGLMHELARAMCEDEPTTPSAAVRRTEPATPVDGRDGHLLTPEAVSATRDGQPEKLYRRLLGDVDAIVLTAMQKEPQRRYASVEQFSEDIRRHLEGTPVLAHPSTLGYRTLKFVRRHKTAVTAVLLIALSVLGGVVATAWTARAAVETRNTAVAAERRAREEAENARVETVKSQRVTTFLQRILMAADPAKHGPEITVRQVLDEATERVGEEFEEDPEVESAVRTAIGETYLGLGQYDEAETQLRRALAIQEGIHGGNHPDVATSLNTLGALLLVRGDYAAARQVCERALQIHRATRGEEHADVARDLHNLALVVRAQGDLAQAKQLLRQALELRRDLLGGEHLEVAETLSELAGVLQAEGQYPAAEELVRQALEIRQKLRGPKHPDVARSLDDLAVLLAAQDCPAEAEALYREALAIHSASPGKDQPQLATTLSHLGILLMARRDYASAEPLLRESVRIWGRILPDSDSRVPCTRGHLARCLMELGRCEEAEPLALASFQHLWATLGDGHPQCHQARETLIALYERIGRPDLAAEQRARTSPLVRAAGAKPQ